MSHNNAPESNHKERPDKPILKDLVQHDWPGCLQNVKAAKTKKGEGLSRCMGPEQPHTNKGAWLVPAAGKSNSLVQRVKLGQSVNFKYGLFRMAATLEILPLDLDRSG